MHHFTVFYFILFMSELNFWLFIQIITINLIALSKVMDRIWWIIIPLYIRNWINYSVCVTLKFDFLKSKKKVLWISFWVWSSVMRLFVLTLVYLYLRRYLNRTFFTCIFLQFQRHFRIFCKKCLFRCIIRFSSRPIDIRYSLLYFKVFFFLFFLFILLILIEFNFLFFSCAEKRIFFVLKHFDNLVVKILFVLINSLIKNV